MLPIKIVNGPSIFWAHIQYESALWIHFASFWHNFPTCAFTLAWVLFVFCLWNFSYIANRVFIALANGCVAVFCRQSGNCIQCISYRFFITPMDWMEISKYTFKKFHWFTTYRLRKWLVDFCKLDCQKHAQNFWQTQYQPLVSSSFEFLEDRGFLFHHKFTYMQTRVLLASALDSYGCWDA